MRREADRAPGRQHRFYLFSSTQHLRQGFADTTFNASVLTISGFFLLGEIISSITKAVAPDELLQSISLLLVLSCAFRQLYASYCDHGALVRRYPQ